MAEGLESVLDVCQYEYGQPVFKADWEAFLVSIDSRGSILLEISFNWKAQAWIINAIATTRCSSIGPHKNRCTY